MHKPKRCLFFDFHTMPACPDVGEKFNPDEFTDRIKRCGVDFIVFPAKCNLGMCYYDTKIGNKHPSLKYDMFGKLVEFCKKKEIAISAYINVGISHEDAIHHREWCRITPEGYIYKPDRLDSFFRLMCYNTPYKDYILEIVKEVVSKYPVDGLFLDCFAPNSPCVCPDCIGEMKEKGIKWDDFEKQKEFVLFSAVRMAERISQTARNLNPELLLYFNGIPYFLQQDIGNYLELECLPTGGWGYDYLPVYAKYLRNLGKPVLNMTGRFHRSWGDFGGIRTEASVEYDVFLGIANTLRVTIGDHMHPRGEINKPVFDLAENIYKKVQKYEIYYENAKPLVDTALIVPEEWMGFSDEDGLSIAKGATRMLSELKMQFDILTDIPEDNGKYKLLIFPDNFLFDDEEEEKLKKYIKNGGKVLLSGYSGINKEKNKFVIEDFGLEFKGELEYDPSFVIVEEKISKDIPDMPMNFYEGGIKISVSDKAEVLARIVAPYYNRHWDGEHGFVYLPPDKITEYPAAIKNRDLIYVSHFVFKSYFHSSPIYLKNFVRNLIEILLPDPIVKTTLPSFAKVLTTYQEKRTILHILTYIPERRGEVNIIEEPVEVTDIDMKLKLDNKEIKKVYDVSQGKEYSFKIENNYVLIKVPYIKGYSIIVFEYKKEKNEKIFYTSNNKVAIK